MTCTVCRHESRVVIDRLLAQGSETVRDVAIQFGLSHAAIQRHKPHILESVAKAVQRTEAKTGDRLRSVWEERLDSAWSAAAEGYTRSQTDAKQWPNGAKFIMAAAKLIDSGLRVDGLIAGGSDRGTTIHVDQVVVLPMGFRPELPAPMDENVIDVHSVSDSSIETYVENSDES